MNTYPLSVSRDMIFSSKESSLKSSMETMTSAMAGLSQLTEENVGQALTVMEVTGVSRAIVTDSAGKILYDTREVGNATGYQVFYTELVEALRGNDAFYFSYKDGAFRTCAAVPVIYRSDHRGGVRL